MASSVDTPFLSAGRLKVFRSNRNWLEEFRVYARDENGKIINELKFRLMATTRYVILDKVGSWITEPWTRRARAESQRSQRNEWAWSYELLSENTDT